MSTLVTGMLPAGPGDMIQAPPKESQRHGPLSLWLLGPWADPPPGGLEPSQVAFVLTPTSVPAPWTSRGPCEGQPPSPGGGPGQRAEGELGGQHAPAACLLQSLSLPVCKLGWWWCLPQSSRWQSESRSRHCHAWGRCTGPLHLFRLWAFRDRRVGEQERFWGGTQSEMFFCSVQPGLHT